MQAGCGEKQRAAGTTDLDLNNRHKSQFVCSDVCVWADFLKTEINTNVKTNLKRNH